MFSSIVFKTFQTLQFSKLACYAIKDNNQDVIKQAGQPALQSFKNLKLKILPLKVKVGALGGQFNQDRQDVLTQNSRCTKYIIVKVIVLTLCTFFSVAVFF